MGPSQMYAKFPTKSSKLEFNEDDLFPLAMLICCITEDCFVDSPTSLPDSGTPNGNICQF